MKVREYLNGGLVQTRHPLELSPGELQTADNTWIKPGDRSIHRQPGRTAYGTVLTTSVASCSVSATTLTTTGSFGTSVAVTAAAEDDTIINAVGGTFSSTVVGQSVWGNNITDGTRVAEVVSDTQIILDRAVTGAVTVLLISDIHDETMVTGAGITDGNSVVSIETETSLTLSISEAVQNNFTCTFADQIDGLEFMPFDNAGDDILLAKADHKLLQSPVTALTGTFSLLKNGLSGASSSRFSSVGYKSKHAIMTGEDIPRVIYYADDESDTTPVLLERAFGMLPVTDKNFDGPIILPGANWPNATGEESQWGAGWYHFLVTEVAKFENGDEIEGTYYGETKAVEITSPESEGIRVHYDTANVVNDGLLGRNTATHWRVYMSFRMAEDEVPSLGQMIRVGDADIGQNTMLLGNTNPVRWGHPSAIEAVSGFAALFDDDTNVVAEAAGETVVGCAFAADSYAVTSTAGFGNVTDGMPVISPSNDLPPECYVTLKTDSSNLSILPKSSAANDDVDLYFGNGKSINQKFGYINAGPSSQDRRAGMFHSFRLGHDIGNFSGATITGIEVTLVGRFESPTDYDPGLSMTLYQGGQGGTATNTVRKEFGTNRSTSVLKFGGPNDLWGFAPGTWVSTDFDEGTSKFGVKLQTHIPFSGEAGAQVGRWVIDGMRVRVFAGSGEIDLFGEPFPVITVTDQLGNPTEFAANGAPPQASTGDLFNGVMVMNNVNNRSEVWGSVPDEEEAFPIIYRIPIQTSDNDHINVIKRIGKVLILGMENSVKRMNYFPLEVDSDFNRGRCYEDIATDHGMVGPRSTVIVDLPGRGTVFAYLSHRGLFWTDGITAYPLNIDIDWENLFEFSLLDNAVLVVYPRQYLLALYYTPSGGTYNNKALYFSYHPTHIKEGGQLPAFGPADVNASSATSGLIDGQSYLFTGHSFDGKAYQEDDGTVSNEDGDEPTMKVRTRRFFPGGQLGTQGRVNHIHLVTDADGDSTSGLFTSTFYRQNEGQALAADNNVADRHTETGGVVGLWQQMFGDTFDIEIQKGANTSDLRIHRIGFETEGYGDSTA